MESYVDECFFIIAGYYGIRTLNGHLTHNAVAVVIIHKVTPKNHPRM